VRNRNAGRSTRPGEVLSDDQLLSALALALREVDPVPPELVDAAKTAFSWRTPNADLARLISDTAVDTTAAEDLRKARTLTFAAGDTTLVLEATERGDKRQLLGHIRPPRRIEIEITDPSRSTAVVTDDSGRFRFDEFPAGPIRLSLQEPNRASRVITPWVNI
jgi:hypothetical protein